jgi:hypothetical protein
MDASVARCGEHPGRAAEVPCTRCGAFLCDWCVKLAPSWGNGLCASCQKRVAAEPAARVPKSGLFMWVSFGVLLGPFLSWHDLQETLALADDPAYVRPVIYAAAGVTVVLLAWNIAAIVLVALRSPRARTVLLAYFAVRIVVSLLAAMAMPAGGFAAWWPVPIQALLFAYVGWSADARALLRQPAKDDGDRVAQPG